MTNENILNLEGEGTQAADGKPPSVADEIKSYLKELVGEDKKFKSEEDLAKSKIEADRFIAHLQEETKGMRETIKELEERIQSASTKEQLESLRKELSRKSEDPAPKEATPSQLAPEDIAKLVEQQITERETKASAKANVDQTNAALVKHFGDPEKATQAVQEKLASMGLSVKDLTAMAAKSPTAALNLVVGSAPAPAAALRKDSSVNSSAITDQYGEMSPKAKFDKLRRERPSEYWSPNVQKQIMQLMREGRYN